MKKKQIIILAAVLLAVIIAGIVAIVVVKTRPAEETECVQHVDADGDGYCDICGEAMPQEPPGESGYEDKIEAIGRYTVTAAEGEGYIIRAPKTAIAGDDVEFTVTYSNYFDASAAVVLANGEELTADADGGYVLSDIRENVTITVEGLSRVCYGVIKLVPQGVTVNGADTVAVDGDYVFTLDTLSGVQGTPQVKVNGDTVTDAAGVYTVEKPNCNLVVEVTGLTAPMVSVSYPQDQGYTIEGTQTVVGGTYLFSVHIDPDYESHTALVVRAGGELLQAVEGVYIVENAPETIEITVEGIALREMITIHFENCDLPDATTYKGAVWEELIPVRTNYLFNGWVDENGDPYILDYQENEVTMYATWLNANGIDYVSRLQEIAVQIAARNAAIADNWLLLNVQDRALAREYQAMYADFTEYEKSTLGEDAVTAAFLEKTQYVSDVLVGTNKSSDTRVVTPVYKTDETTTMEAAVNNTVSIAGGQYFDGVNYNIQKKDSAGQVVLDYVYAFDLFDFEEYCSEYGKVTFWMDANYEGMTVSLGDTLLFETAKNVPAPDNPNNWHCLYRIDIQAGSVYVNGEYKCDLDENVYNGTEALNLSVHRLESHTYAAMDISNIYAGEADPALVRPNP